MTTIICTVGTSSIGKLGMEKFYWNGKSNPLANKQFFNGFEEIKNDYSLYGLQKTKPSLDQKYLPQALEPFKKNMAAFGHFSRWKEQEDVWRIFPAEVVSTIRLIQKLNLSPNEVTIELLGTDTADGYIAIRILEYIFSYYRFKVHYATISGFQMKDMGIFKTEGLKNFIVKVKGIVKNSDNETYHFNITGGYKNFIPLVTHIASFYQLDMYYVFEEMVAHNDSIVQIPNVPTFNRILFDKHSNIDNYAVIAEIIDEIAENEYFHSQDVEQDILDRLEVEFKDMGETLPIILTEFIMKFFELKNQRVEMTLFGYLYKNLLIS